MISKAVEINSFHIGVRRGSDGRRLRITDGNPRRIRVAVSKPAATFSLLEQIPLPEFLSGAQ